MLSMALSSCTHSGTKEDSFNYFADRFADVRILRYQVPGFETLTLRQKKLAYYLSQATLSGRDILTDQFYKHNLRIRKTLEEIYEKYRGNREEEQFKQFIVYLKRVWFSNGIHHHYSTEKIIPSFRPEYLASLIHETPNGEWPLFHGQDKNAFIAWISKVLFDTSFEAKRVNLDASKGLISGSANNFYEGVSDDEVEKYYNSIRTDDESPIEYGLNSKVVKENGNIVEKVWKKGGMYSPAIEKIIYWLEKARTVAENDQQKKAIAMLIEYYSTGDLKKWDEFNILWVHDTTGSIDFINGFVEVYGDPLGIKGTWEGVVQLIDTDGTKRAEILSKNAQWFEDNSPVDKRFKKTVVKGITARAVHFIQLGGDCYPYAPLGINLPNADWIRKVHGSKSVTVTNIIDANFNASLHDGFLEEFAWSSQEVELARTYYSKGFALEVDMHECLGHASGQLLPGISTDMLKNYYSTLEEARADLFALYYIMDEKLIELHLMPSPDMGKAVYDAFIRNGLLTQLTKIELGKTLEESHMRNRQLLCQWAMEKGKADKVIERKQKDGKTFFVINDYIKLRNLFGALLQEIQRIKSEGDFEAGKQLVETYGIHIDYDLHKEVLERYQKLNLAPYTGFINPVLTPVINAETITDIKIEYPADYAAQMMYYSKNYSFLQP